VYIYVHLSFTLYLDFEALIEIYETLRMFYFDCLIMGLFFFRIAPLIALHDVSVVLPVALIIPLMLTFVISVEMLVEMLVFFKFAKLFLTVTNPPV
jgi:hypothetical protein